MRYSADIAWIQKALIAAVYLAFFVPLMKKFSFVGIPTWSLPAVPLVVFVALRRISARKLGDFSFDLWDWSVLGFIGAMALSTTLNEPADFQYASNKLFAFGMALVFAIFIRKTWGDVFNRHNLVFFFYSAVFVQFAVSVAQFVTGSPVGYLPLYFGVSTEAPPAFHTGEYGPAIRVIGTLGGPNGVGLLMVMSLPLIATYGLADPDRTSFVHYIGKRVAILAAVATVGLTASRSSALVLVGLAVSSVFVYYRQRIQGRAGQISPRSFLGAIFVTLLVAVGGVYAVQLGVGGTVWNIAESVRSRFREFTQLEAAQSIRIRAQLLVGALKLFISNPLLGVGYFNTAGIATEFPLYFSTFVPVEVRVHNLYLEYLAEGGLAAFVPLVYFTLYPLYALVLRLEGFDGFRYGLVGSLVAGLAIALTSAAYDSPANGPTYAILFGAAMGYWDRCRRASGRRRRQENA